MRQLIQLSVSLLGLWSLQAVAEHHPRLVFLTWDDHIAPELVSEFEQRYGVELVERHFHSDQERTELLQAQEGRGFDLVLTSGSDIRWYAQQGWLAPLQSEWLPTLEQLEPGWRDAFAGSARYGQPYSWSTAGIAYRSDLLSQVPSRWMDLFQPNAELQGYIQMTDDCSELVQAALKALGFSLNSRHAQELEQAQLLLLNQRDHVARYAYCAEHGRSPLLSGQIRAAYCYSGDALRLQELHPGIRFVVPEEGSQLRADYIAIGAHAAEPGLAYRFLNYINQPEQAVRNARYLRSATPNLNARALLPRALRQHPQVYPPQDVLARSEFSRITYAIQQQHRQMAAGIRIY